MPENAVNCPGLLLETEHSSYVAVRVEKWPQSMKTRHDPFCHGNRTRIYCKNQASQDITGTKKHIYALRLLNPVRN